MRIHLLLVLAPVLAFGQTPRVGVIDFYGVHKVSPEKIRRTLEVKEGDPIPSSKGNLEDKVAELDGVVRAEVQAFCCDDGRITLFVGIEEQGAPHYSDREPPQGEAQLPEAISDAYQEFVSTLRGAGPGSDSLEDWSQGHSLVGNPESRAIQEKFVALAKDNLPSLQEVLKEASDPEERVIASYVIGYAPKKSSIVADLQYALRDPEEGVRINAVRSLTGIALLGRKNPSLGIRVEPTWMVEMLNSVNLADRHSAVLTLTKLTDDRDASTLELLKERSMPALLEMAKWKTLSQALPAYLLLGRVAGLPEEEVEKAWREGRRDAMIAQIEKDLKKKE